MANVKKYEIDMVHCPLFKNILIFYFPLMLSSMLQLLFNAADVIVVGRFAGSNSLAAVGSTGPLVNLMVSLFMGISVGVNVMVARYYGANQETDLKETVHTSMLSAVFFGTFLMIVGLLIVKKALILMGSPEEVLDLATLYLRIYFIGMPFSMIYNFGAAILRAVGDTKRPLIYLSVSGFVNVILNLIFVILLSMNVAGVALATVISQALSAVLVVRCLMKSDGVYRLILKELRISKDKLIKIIQIGLPAGIQGSLFSFSNVIIQSSVNSFGSIAIAGNSAGQNIEGFVYMAMNAFYQTAISFVGQNYGALRFDRIKKIMWICLGCVTFVGLFMGNAAYVFGNQLLGLYSTDPEVISYGIVRLQYICVIYFLCGIMDVMVGVIRGMGYSIMPMLVSLTGACLLRLVWIFTYFQTHHELKVLYISYPISWMTMFSIHLICFYICFHIQKKKHTT